MIHRSDLPFYHRFCANLFPLSVTISERLKAFQNLGPSQIAQGQLQSGRKKYDLVPILFGFSLETAAPEVPVRNQHFSEIGLWEDEIMCSGPNHFFSPASHPFSIDFWWQIGRISHQFFCNPDKKRKENPSDALVFPRIDQITRFDRFICQVKIVLCQKHKRNSFPLQNLNQKDVWTSIEEH